jgi:hypothetical protein
MPRDFHSRPRQAVFFNDKEMPSENWCWTVESRHWLEGWDISQGTFMHEGVWGHWLPIRGVSHFRTEELAEKMMSVLRGNLAQYFPERVGKIEYRVAPKYIGYVPSEDEVWIK